MAKYQLHDEVSLKKGHPCGENHWRIMRTGVDVKLQCLGCDRQIWLSRIDFEKKLRKIKDKNGKFISIVNFVREE